MGVYKMLVLNCQKMLEINCHFLLESTCRLQFSAPVYFSINVFRENEVLLANANMEINWLQK